RGGQQVRGGVGVARQAPAARGSLRQQDPCALCQSRVTGGRGDQIRELPYRGELLVAVQRAGIGKNLNPYVGAVAINVCERGRRERMDDRGGVLSEHRDVRDSFNCHQGGREVL